VSPLPAGTSGATGPRPPPPRALTRAATPAPRTPRFPPSTVDASGEVPCSGTHVSRPP
jgi:hypothetical protein